MAVIWLWTNPIRRFWSTGIKAKVRYVAPVTYRGCKWQGRLTAEDLLLRSQWQKSGEKRCLLPGDTMKIQHESLSSLTQTAIIPEVQYYNFFFLNHCITMLIILRTVTKSKALQYKTNSSRMSIQSKISLYRIWFKCIFLPLLAVRSVKMSKVIYKVTYEVICTDVVHEAKDNLLNSLKLYLIL